MNHEVCVAVKNIPVAMNIVAVNRVNAILLYHENLKDV